MSLLARGMDLAEIINLIKEDKMRCAGQYRLSKRTRNQISMTVPTKVLQAYGWDEGTEVHALYFPEEAAKNLDEKDRIMVLRLAAKPDR